jgi:unsaturated rhamnogalacturonyl hydrolase
MEACVLKMKQDMINIYRRIIAAFTMIAVFISACSVQRSGKISTSKAEVLAIINKVNTYWQTQHPEPGRAFWDVAAYHTGNMETYFLTKNENYRLYSEKWAEHNQWMGAKSTDKASWKYNYGETDDHVLFGDWQICFQTYIDLYNIHKDDKKIKRAIEVMEYEMSTARNDYWWWADGLYMVMPVMTKLYKVTGNKLYLEKLYEYLMYANSIMYDAEEKLYYRDAKYVYPKHKSAHGKKDFWARGDGWVFAGLAKVLKDLPANDAHRAEYITKYKGMAAAIKQAQQPGGYWTRSLLDSAHAPGPETSGTAFFTYGLLWGINNKYLDKKKYLPVVKKSWDYLVNTALQDDGKIGYVQPIGERAIPGQVVDRNSTSNFGVGAFLLAACEMYRYIDGECYSSATHH